jgi:hypothetical protein
MTTFLYNQVTPDTYKDVSESSNTPEFKDTVTVTPPSFSPISQEEFKLAAEVLQMAEIKHTANATMLLRQTISQQYKKVSEDLDPVANKKNVRKKSMRDLMQQSFFHGANWMGSNFIA